MSTATVAAFIPAQRPASEPAPAAPAPRIPGPRTTSRVEAPLPRTTAERRAYAIQTVADAYYDLYADVFTTAPGGAR